MTATRLKFAVKQMSWIAGGFIGLFAILPVTPARSQDKPWMADQFVDSVGVNTHIPYKSTPYYTNFTQCKSLLIGLGVRHIRDTMTTDNSGSFNTHIPSLGAAGIKSDLVITPTWMTAAQALAVTTQYLLGSQEIVEGPNEWDLSKDPQWMNTFNAYTTQIQSAYHGNPSTATMPIYSGTIVTRANVNAYKSTYGDVSSHVNYGNCHPYCWAFPPNDPEDHLPSLIPWWSPLWGNAPFVMTETGYFTGTAQFNVDATVQGKYITRTLFTAFNNLSRRTYLYEFYDESSDKTNSESNYGLVYNNGTVKPAYTGIKNLISLLADPGSSFNTGSLTWSISGQPTGFNHTLFQKRNGSYYMVVWIGGPSTDSTISVPVTLTITSPQINTARLYSLDKNGNISSSAKTISHSHISFNLTDYVQVLKLN